MKKINSERVLLVALVGVAFCGFLIWSIQQTSSEEESFYSSSNLLKIGEALKNTKITVSSPKNLDGIKSPLAISGQAKVSDNRLRVRIKDNKGMTLAESFVQVKNTDQMSDFSLSLKYKKPTATAGFVEVFLVMPNGGEIYKLSVPVMFSN